RGSLELLTTSPTLPYWRTRETLALILEGGKEEHSLPECFPQKCRCLSAKKCDIHVLNSKWQHEERHELKTSVDSKKLSNTYSLKQNISEVSEDEVWFNIWDSTFPPITELVLKIGGEK
ncbi:hypothetical protein C0J52_20732, partial [Blattella germanica]